MDEPIQRWAQVNGIRLSYFEWGLAWRGREASLLLAHATGFHARCWDQVIAHLGERHVIAVDQRGHGRSDKMPITDWRILGEDLDALVRALELRDLVGVGHSMGGHAMVEAAAAAPERYQRLVLLDPVIGSPEFYGSAWSAALLAGGDHPTARRRRHFASAEEMIERFRHRPPYTAFTEAALRDYCVHGLLPAPEGGFELACPPAIEASVYMSSLSNPGVHDRVRRLELPVLVVRAQQPPTHREAMDFSYSPTWPGLAQALPQGRDLHWADCTHFLPMQVPERVARVITG